MFILNHLWIIPALPLLGAALNGLLGTRWPKRAIDAIAVGTTGLSFLAVLELIREFAALAANQIPWAPAGYFPWLLAGNFRADFALHVDQLTVVMLLVVTGVGWLIHIYSTGYMAHEGGYYRFFSYLNLFMFFMLILVMAANYALLFVGWEGVGLCSYLLIGFFFLKKSASDAGKKAFIVNRIGDFGFMLGMFLMFQTFGSLDFATVFPAAAKMPLESMSAAGVLTAIALLLFVGATGKSAQLPLYVWLPDAMEGPTPVSALIHAATMVTAGVYVVARSSVIFSHAPLAMAVVAVIGCVTALFAATIGLAQNDIKRVLAYSTVSQLGYMMLACGVGAFSAGIFHLMTHSFFKALLFLAAGSVIHAMGGEQDLRKMGGLRTKIPWTFWTMFMATLAIAGAPFFSGFFSKDAILWKAVSSLYGTPASNKLLWGVGLATAVLTSVYMFRLLFLAFFGAPRYDEQQVHVHESPKSMIVPLVVLALLSVVGGWVGIPESLSGSDYIEHFLSPAFAAAEKAAPEVTPVHATKYSHSLEMLLMGAAIFGAALGALVAWRRFMLGKPGRLEGTAFQKNVQKLLTNKYYVDEIYDALVVRPLYWLSNTVFWRSVDERGIDGSVNGLAHAARAAGERVRQVQSGNTRSYATWVVLGAVAVTTLLIWWVK
ncbi:MAG: NADH-quinone oxidoreductase subunit L [Acidobacteria bacterium]|nr:NADH-quinone oxidoreductase subunit L [Acidobacteriota bacterium]MBI3662479.1 NADH-quinone oxidoreductase subunit L [Acidobacteriota bacterium]